MLPGLLRGDVLRDTKAPNLRRLIEGSRLIGFSLPDVETPEAIWLGLSPVEGQLRQGPLTVSALGFDPPARSIHFHVTPLSTDGSSMTPLEHAIGEADLRTLFGEAKKLNGKLLTLLQGEDRDHALVLEGLGDLGTNPPEPGGQIREHWPNGDFEGLLRRFIDDSVNLLSELELNQRRIDEGLQPINLLWPWGHGVRLPVPNLALKRGVAAEVFGPSLRLAGLARLAGYRPDRASFGGALRTKWEALGKKLSRSDAALAVFDLAALTDEEAAWSLERIDQEALGPVLDALIAEPRGFTLVATSGDSGLALQWVGGASSGDLPFDERAFEERRLPRLDAWSILASALG